MLGTSLPALIFIRACIFGLQSVAPISIVYTLFALCTQTRALPLPVEVWFGAETLFYFGWYLLWKERLQKPARHPPPHSSIERRKLFTRCLAVVNSPTLYLSGWFHGAPAESVYRENLAEFLTWGFFYRDSPPPAESDEAAELRDYIEEFERALGHDLPTGYNPKVRSLRLTLDPVHMGHRSLLWYWMVHFVDVLTSFRLVYHGFKLFPTAGWMEVFPGRPHAALVSSGINSPTKDLSYWFRPHKSNDKLPVVFLHGLGIGLYPYVPFLSEIAKEVGDDVGVIVVEIMPVSTRICGDALTPPEFARQILQILDFHRIDRFVLTGHSYGTILSTHLLHCPKLGPRIDSLVLIDPIAFLLHLPNVAYNFTSRPPLSANHYQLEYFASRDPGIAHTICRHFFWTQNILWKEDLRGRRCAVVLGGKDLLVDAGEIWAYLTGETASSASVGWDRVWGGEEITVLWFGKADHAQVFDIEGRRARLIEIVGDFSGR